MTRYQEEEEWQECEEDSCYSLSSSSSSSARSSSESSEEEFTDWKSKCRRGGSLAQVDLNKGIGGWSSPPGKLFHVRGPSYFSKKTKVPAEKWLFEPVGVDWLRSSTRLDHVLARSNHRILTAVEEAKIAGEAKESFIVAVNLQVPGKEHHSAIFYYAVDEPILPGTLLHKFIHGEDDTFRNNRFKLINRVVKGPWIVRTAVGNHAACLLGRALTCRYMRGPNYLEIDVDIGSSTVASYILHLALGYVSSVSVDMAFLVEAQSEDELPERIMGAVRISQISMESAVHVEPENIRVSPILQANHSRKKMSRGFSLLGYGGKVDDEHTRCERAD